MALLTKDQILSADDRPTRMVPVPEWGGDVIVSTLTGRERDAWEASMIADDQKTMTIDDVRAKLCVKVLVDENGDRIFSDNDAEQLTLKSCAALDRVFQAAKDLNALSDEDVEELAKNSESDPGESSASN